MLLSLDGVVVVVVVALSVLGLQPRPVLLDDGGGRVLDDGVLDHVVRLVDGVVGEEVPQITPERLNFKLLLSVYKRSHKYTIVC